MWALRWTLAAFGTCMSRNKVHLRLHCSRSQLTPWSSPGPVVWYVEVPAYKFLTRGSLSSADALGEAEGYCRGMNAIAIARQIRQC
jgi:hypothetical protein